MSTTLYYFSGTGNSYHVAKEIQKRLGECQLIPITDYLGQTEVEATSQKVGLIFPLYFQGMPKVVSEFIQKLSIKNESYIFAVVTRGSGAYQGGALGHLKKALEEKNRNLSAGYYISMPENYIPLLKVQSEEKQKKLFQNAEIKIKKICMLVNTNSKKIETEIIGFIRPLSYNPFIKSLNTIDTDFNASDKCNGCGLCAEVCHFENIQIQEEKPKWQKNCQSCLACMHYCPAQAIELKKSKNKIRYHHPSVSASEYIKTKPAK